MGAEHVGSRTRDTREWWISAGILTLIVLFRSAVPVVWPLSYFDSDQAITGLMAKHLSELHAFPVSTTARITCWPWKRGSPRPYSCSPGSR